MENFYSQKILNTNNVFKDDFLDSKILYLHCFNTLPSVNFINQVNGEKALKAFKEKFADCISHVHHTQWYKKRTKKYQFDKTVVILKNRFVLEFDDYYCEMLHDSTDHDFLREVTAVISQFKSRERREPLEINLIVNNNGRHSLRSMEIKRTRLGLDLFYEDDFKPVDQVIQQRLGKKKDKGIVLLHGLPGTGKTTYLRYLVGKIKKRVLFLSPSVAGNLMNPDFIELLISNPNTVLIIEDAENIIMDRKYNSGSSVSGLLNISDGLLADFLNVQLICTFNSSLTMIDSALMRKGRLIAKYEFGKLGIDKSQKLSNHLGFTETITKPMTIAEITNPDQADQPAEKVQVIGFKRQGVLLN